MSDRLWPVTGWKVALTRLMGSAGFYQCMSLRWVTDAGLPLSNPDESPQSKVKAKHCLSTRQTTFIT